MLSLAAAYYAYCAAYLVSILVNGTVAADAVLLLYLVPFGLLPFSYSVWSISDKRAVRLASLYGSMLACYGALALALIQHYGFGMRAEGGSGNAIVFATTACLASMLCLTGVLCETGKLRWALFGAVLAGAVAILYSQSRIVWVAFPVSGALMLLVFRRELKVLVSMKSFVLVLLACAVVLAAGYKLIGDRVDDLETDLSTLGQSGQPGTALGFRLALWESGLDAFRQSPVFGHGVSASRAIITDELHKEFGSVQRFTHFHNGFITALVEAGLLGALALAGIFVVAIANACIALRANDGVVERYGAAMILAAACTYLVGGLTGIVVHQDVLDSTLLVFLIVGTYLAAGTSKARPGTGPA